MEIVRSFKKVDRSYHSTENGWRLATFEEAKNGLERNMVQQHLKEWERARLLDGWISGSGYGYAIKNEFRGCMGNMLLIETHTSAENASGTPYADVNLSELGKEVALLLCVDDWNYEVVYWLLNSWSRSQTMNLPDVRGGNLPFVNATEFKKMNEDIGRLARRLGDEEVQAREKGRMTKYSGTDSVEEVLSGMMQIVTEEEKITGYRMRSFTGYGGDGYYLPDFAQGGDVAEVFWSFVCETFAGYVVEKSANDSLKNILSILKTNRTSEKNLMIPTSILLYLSDGRSDIIHEPLPHSCWGNCAREFLSDVEKKAGGEPDRFSEMLKHNAMWRCHDDTGNYGVLNKLLFFVTFHLNDNSDLVMTMSGITAAALDMLLECSAEPAGWYAIHNDLKNTTLHNAAEFEDKDVSRQVAQLLLDRCAKETSRTCFVNAVNESKMTALHIASARGNASLCQLLVEFNASLNSHDRDGMTPLHYALEGEGTDDVINVLVEFPQVAELVELKDQRGDTPIDIAIAMNDYASTAKLLSMSKKPEAYLVKWMIRNSSSATLY